MLSKSQARSFFLLGTALCTVAFIALTVDTFKRIPQQTNEQNLTPEVVRGKHLFEKNNCMGCHTIMGEGAYYAPELTKVFERRGDTYIKAMLKDPQAMFPEGRKMTNYHFTDEEISDLTQFLKWVGEMDLNGFPAKPDLAVSRVAQMKLPKKYEQTCVACHSLNNQGGAVGPKLDGVGSRLTAEYITNWLRDPSKIKADSKMPKFPLTESEISELTTFLMQLKEGQSL